MAVAAPAARLLVTPRRVSVRTTPAAVPARAGSSFASRGAVSSVAAAASAFLGRFSAPVLRAERKQPPAPARVTEATKSPNRQAKGGKVKTRKSAAKRYKITATGKVIRRGAGCKHLLRKKSSNKRSVLAGEKVVNERDMNNIISMLPYAGLR